MTDCIDDSLSQELTEIAQSLEILERRIFAVRQKTLCATTGKLSVLEQARLHYLRRRSREKLFKSQQLFGEPAWDMLVDLFIAAEQQKNISISSLCVAAAVPQTTALRWIAILESQGLVKRTADKSDARRVHIALTSTAYRQVKMHFEQYGV
jgi:DNA-binding MarR family transcriptional regulator